MPVVDMVSFWGRTAPLHPAMIEPAGVVTYASLALGVEAAAERFSHDIADRSRPVAVAARSGPKLLVATLGLLRAGFDAIPVSGAHYRVLSGLGVSTLVHERDAPPLPGGRNIPFDDAWLVRGFQAKNSVPVTKTAGGQVFCVTSDAAGQPKATACPQDHGRQQTLASPDTAYSTDERTLIVPDLVTPWSIGRAFAVLHTGRTLCLAPPGPSTLWTMNTYDVDILLASPRQLLELAELQEKATRYPLASLRAIHLVGGRIGRADILRVKQSLCPNIVLFYGSAEAGVAALAPYDMIADVPGAVGFVTPGVDVEIVDTARQPLPCGQEGFVRVRPAAPAGSTAAPPPADRWFYPGDRGTLTENGILCITGRHGDTISRGGETFAIAGIESFLLGCPGVRKAAVCTVAGATGPAEVWTALVLRPNADMTALGQALESDGRDRRNIDKIFVVEGLPRDALGEIDGGELKAMLQEIAEEHVRSGGR
jgi:acyl-coenzyme A synthetase/AMP-(fatty) acid ligase